MLLKLGVDISRLERPIRRALNKIESIYQRIAMEEAVITSTYEGNHSPGSLHYANLAVDIRLPSDREIRGVIAIKLKEELGPDYDVVLEANHIHIEYDPKG